MVSSGDTFELGFFNPGNKNTNRFVGIWYKNIPVRRVVWVANRNNPIPIKDNSTRLIISQDGNLVLLSKNQTLLWSTNTTAKALSPIVQLLDNGNLVLKDDSSNNSNNNNEQSFLWQSFDHPSDTLLSGMKLRWDRKNNINHSLSAWKNWDDPSIGDFTFDTVHGNYPEVVMSKGLKPFYRSGPWNGIGLSGTSALKENPLYTYQFVNDTDDVYYKYTLKNSSVVSIIVMNQTLSLRQRITWVSQTRSWTVYQSSPQDSCDGYNLCGAYGNCVIDASPVCQCLDGFEPRSLQNWNAMDWSHGCVRSNAWSCGVKNKDGFRRFSGMKLPDTLHSWVDANMTLEDCKAKCLENCSCTAYTNLDIRGTGSGCAIWFGDLNDMRISATGQDLYVRMAASDFKQNRKIKFTLAIAISVSLVVIVLLALSYIYWRIIKYRGKKKDVKEDFELPFFDFKTMVNATNNFSDDKKLGQGGFGPVYKGTLPDGQEVAVKRLSSGPGQGLNEFKNEVTLCAKLQHRNLVKVIGYCVEGEEKMLLYEYMPNKSLDSFIFDFGLARMFGGDQIEGNTNRIVGTYGYIAPEYLIEGLFSTKSDLFSFGVLLLEIISARRNKGLPDPSHSHNLIGHAWRLWKEEKPEEFVDASMKDTCNVSDAVHCIQIGLLCVQHHPDDRPNMTSVVVMLSREYTLPQPKEPTCFFHGKNDSHEELNSSGKQASSNNEVTLSLISAR